MNHQQWYIFRSRCSRLDENNYEICDDCDDVIYIHGDVNGHDSIAKDDNVSSATVDELHQDEREKSREETVKYEKIEP